MKVGFTGTQRGMTDAQREMLYALLSDVAELDDGFSEAHHGDCIGADAQFHELVVEQFGEVTQTVLHPPTDSRKRAYCTAVSTRRAQSYLDRNREIVDSVDLMIATPGVFKEVLRSGTWATIRYARARGGLLVIVYPDGTVERFGT